MARGAVARTRPKRGQGENTVRSPSWATKLAKADGRGLDPARCVSHSAGEKGFSYLRRLTLSVLPCCCDTMAGTGCGARGSRRGKVATGCRCWSRGTGYCRAGGERVSPSGDSAAGSGRRPSTGSSAATATAAQTP